MQALARVPQASLYEKYFLFVLVICISPLDNMYIGLLKTNCSERKVEREKIVN